MTKLTEAEEEPGGLKPGYIALINYEGTPLEYRMQTEEYVIHNNDIFNFRVGRNREGRYESSGNVVKEGGTLAPGKSHAGQRPVRTDPARTSVHRSPVFSAWHAVELRRSCAGFGKPGIHRHHASLNKAEQNDS